jgi:hypothetical protein
MRRTVTALLLLLLLSGAASALAQPGPTKQSDPKTAAAKRAPQQDGNCVGVVSNLGEKLTVRRIVYGLIGSELNEVPVDSWHIDDLAVAKISAALGKRTAVRRMPYHKEAFVSRGTLFRDAEAEIREGVRTLAAGTRCARYLFVTRTYYHDLRIGGIGILRTGIGEPFTKVNAYALFSLRLYDGETFTLLKRASAPSEESILWQPIRGPHRRVDESFWPESPRNAAQDARLREAIRELVSQGMDATLAELPLTE